MARAKKAWTSASGRPPPGVTREEWKAALERSEMRLIDAHIRAEIRRYGKPPTDDEIKAFLRLARGQAKSPPPSPQTPQPTNQRKQMGKVLRMEDKIGFGKYGSKTIEDVLEFDPGYLDWMRRKVTRVTLDETVQHELDLQLESRRRFNPEDERR